MLKSFKSLIWQYIIALGLTISTLWLKWVMVRMQWHRTLIRKLGQEDGSILRWYSIVLRHIFLPLNSIYHWINHIGSMHYHYDMMRDVFTINGMRYTGELFSSLGIGGVPEGTMFKLVKREDGLITVERIENYTFELREN